MHWVSGGFLSKFSDCWAFGDMVRIWRAFFESQVTLSIGRNTPLTNSDDTSKFWVFRYPWRFPIIATNRFFVRPRCPIVSGVYVIYWPNSFRLWGRNLKCSFELNFGWSPFSPNSGIVCFGSFFFWHIQSSWIHCTHDRKICICELVLRILSSAMGYEKSLKVT